MGYVDDGGTGHGGHGSHGDSARTITSLVADPDRPADVSVTLTVRKERFRLASGREIDGYTVNGRSPGPLIEATVGQLVEVRLVNESVPDGATLHWHGVDVPNAADGVAGITQDAVRPGEQFVYRFVPDQAGTFWYHSHQISHEQVIGGLLGPLVVRPTGSADEVTDVVTLTHLYRGIRTLNGQENDIAVTIPPGSRARVRVINTDNGPTSVWVTGASARLVAVDGTDLNGPTSIDGEAVLVTAGARADLEVTMPAGGAPVRIQVGGALSVVLGSSSFDAPFASRPTATVDLLRYGTPAPLGFNADERDRTFRYDIGRRFGFLDGKPAYYWTVNDRLYPDVPTYLVSDGDVVRMTISNNSGEVHPMHLHGHHVVVLSRNGVAATGSPWWVDSLNVDDGETYEIAFVADNPGTWADHCHNLNHAVEGLIVHLMYEGVTTPYVLGGEHGNRPE
ncbi:multicopper oxidase family protein [Asanoa iriomotensis]|nr:multicopper oxidase family protein [Asanoa iriomotensis]